jgi:hypothetical protein
MRRAALVEYVPALDGGERLGSAAAAAEGEVAPMDPLRYPDAGDEQPKTTPTTSREAVVNQTKFP